MREFYRIKEDDTGFERRIITEAQAKKLLSNPKTASEVVLMDSEYGYAALWASIIRATTPYKQNVAHKGASGGVEP